MKKDRQLHLRLTKEEYETISQKAAKAKMTMSSFVLMSCLNKQIFVIDGLDEVIKQQKYIGNNLNQLAKLAQSGAIAAIGLNDMVTDHHEIFEVLNDMVKRKRWRNGNG